MNDKEPAWVQSVPIGLSEQLKQEASTNELRAANKELNVRAAWEPEFDATSPDQERLAIKFCEEISGKKGDKPSLPDPVRLLEMAQALYLAERKDFISAKSKT